MNENKEVSKNLVCVLIRGGVEIWMEREKIEPFLDAMDKKQIIHLDGNIINTVDISGIFKPEVMQERTRRKNGDWQDTKGNWHQRGERVCPKCQRYLPQGMTCGTCRF